MKTKQIRICVYEIRKRGVKIMDDVLRGKNITLTIGIPTINSSRYIYKSLQRMKNEMFSLPDNITCELVVCLNGTKDGGKSESEIKRFMSDNPGLCSKFIEVEEPGKNRALNAIIKYARLRESQILHFFDDNIYLKEGSLLVDIKTLLEAQEKMDTPVLVGSNFIGIPRSLEYFIDKEKSILKAIKCWALHNIFITPFRFNSDRPRFCIGQSLGAFTSTFPYYPDDNTGIADDGFICNYYALKGKELFLQKGINPIIKPQDSIVYFNVATSYREWLRQQVRIFVGVYYSYMLYEKEMDFFNDFFSWEYSVGKSLRRMTSNNGLKHKLLRSILRIMQKQVFTKSMKVINERQAPDWSIAASTKI